MRPTVGRVVWYCDYAGVAVAAIVTGTYETPPDAVDLAIFPRGDTPGVAICSREGTASGCWSWPPRVGL